MRPDAPYKKKKTWRLKPRLHRQNPPPRVEEGAVKLRYFIQSAEADIVCVGAVSTAVLSDLDAIFMVARSAFR